MVLRNVHRTIADSSVAVKQQYKRHVGCVLSALKHDILELMNRQVGEAAAWTQSESHLLMFH